MICLRNENPSSRVPHTWRINDKVPPPLLWKLAVELLYVGFSFLMYYLYMSRITLVDLKKWVQIFDRIYEIKLVTG